MGKFSPRSPLNVSSPSINTVKRFANTKEEINILCGSLTLPDTISLSDVENNLTN